MNITITDATPAQIRAIEAILQPKAEAATTERPAPKFRSEAAKAKGREAADAIWARHYAAAGVKSFKALNAKQQAAAKAEVAAAWKAVKGTRKTKA